MKERPILMNGAMVRATLDGSKTQTRRIVKGIALEWLQDGFTPEYVALPENGNSPFGYVGDRLWVREAFAETRIHQSAWPATTYVYRECDNRTDYGGPWKPSIHMPRAASRITLGITNVRIERLNDISEDDAKAEGADCLITANCTPQSRALLDMPLMDDTAPYRNGFALLWESINGDGSWTANPWVWVIENNVVKP